MSQLVAYYDENPVELKGQVEIHQSPILSAAGSRSVEGAIRTSLVYVGVPSEAGPFLVPFGEYDDWSLRDRYNEAIRIMNTLGASAIVCETYGEVVVRRGVRAKVLGRGGELTQQRIENSGFDFRHNGAGSAPRDPSPLRWPDEPGFSAAVDAKSSGPIWAPKSPSPTPTVIPAIDATSGVQESCKFHALTPEMHNPAELAMPGAPARVAPNAARHKPKTRRRVGARHGRVFIPESCRAQALAILARRAESSVRTSARPSPRARSRVAWMRRWVWESESST